MSTAPPEIDEIRKKMAQIRRDLHADVQGVVQGAEAATDWRRFVRGYPWASMGVALAVGYMIVPQTPQDPDPPGRAGRDREGRGPRGAEGSRAGDEEGQGVARNRLRPGGSRRLEGGPGLCLAVRRAVDGAEGCPADAACIPNSPRPSAASKPLRPRRGRPHQVREVHKSVLKVRPASESTHPTSTSTTPGFGARSQAMVDRTQSLESGLSAGSMTSRKKPWTSRRRPASSSRAAANSLRDYIVKEPTRALGIALGMGVILGWLIKRR